MNLKGGFKILFTRMDVFLPLALLALHLATPHKLAPKGGKK